MINNIDLYRDNIRDCLSCNDLSKLNLSSILVVGASGMIGSCIVDVLNELNDTYNADIMIYAGIRDLKNMPERFKSYKNFECLEINVLNPITIDKRIDYIVNCASNSGPDSFAKEPTQTLLANVIGTKNVMEYAIDKGTKRILYVSSGEVYGEDRRDDAKSFEEEYVGNIDSMLPRSCYPIGKKASETLMVSYSQESGVETIIARPCHTYGPTQTEKDVRASSAFLRNAVNGQNIIMKSEGKQIRTYLYVVDCAVGILVALQNGQNLNAYNISNFDTAISIADFAKIIEANSSSKVIFELPNESEIKLFNR